MVYNNTENDFNTNFLSVTGVIREIRDFSEGGCVKLFSIVSSNGSVTDFIVDSATYFPFETPFEEGMNVTFYYDANLPAVLIYPPQFRAVVDIETDSGYEGSIKVDYFDSELISSDNSLKLNISEDTKIYMTNGQYFSGDIGEHSLVVFYTSSSRSIPAQTTPDKITVLCNC